MSSAAFRAFSCERFDTGREFLRADLSVECSTATHVSETHEAAKKLAFAAIMIYPVGISVLYIIAFAYARPAIRESRPTRLTQAIAFLSRDFESDYMWWEARFCTYQTTCLYFDERCILIASSAHIWSLSPAPPHPSCCVRD